MKKNQVTRRHFLKAASAGTALMTLPALFGSCAPKTSERPNILWLVSEDNSVFLGCYGDKFATTPNLDKFASEGILYLNAFVTAPVCAPSRSTIISGMYPPCMGTQHMRSMNNIPEFVKFFPQYLRAAGYYCTNNAKEDYNMPKPEGAWDESSKKAHYKNRKPGQPFFAVFNTEISHESCLHTTETSLTHDPAQVQLPPYHPDTPEIRHDWAQYYDKVQQMDAKIAEFLVELEKEGLAEDTIVFYYADNGGVLTRSKRFLNDTGTHVPLIVRFPKKYQHLAPAAPGTWLDQLVSFVDLAPTVLNLAGLPIPEYMQGQAFLGPTTKPPREYIHLFRGRMDERYDMMRAVRDKKYKYIRNYMPMRIYGQHLNYLWKMPATQSWEQAYKDGKCDEIQSIFWNPKPAEELYDTEADPWEVQNLVDNPDYQEVLTRMREATDKWIFDMRDSGFMPEGELLEKAKEKTLYEVVHDPSYALDKIKETADMAISRNPEHLAELVNRLSDENSTVRYWAATGCIVLGEKSQSAVPDLIKALQDPVPDVRVAAAEALCGLGKVKEGLAVLSKELENENTKVGLHAINVLECLGELAKPALPVVKKAAETSSDPYIVRAAEYFVEKFQVKK